MWLLLFYFLLILPTFPNYFYTERSLEKQNNYMYDYMTAVSVIWEPGKHMGDMRFNWLAWSW